MQSRRLQAQAPAAGLRLERLPVSLASSGPGERGTEAGWTCEAKAGSGAARRAEAEETRVGAADFRDARKPGEGLEQHGGSELRHRGERELTYHFTTPADFARDRHAGYSIQLFERGAEHLGLRGGVMPEPELAGAPGKCDSFEDLFGRLGAEAAQRREAAVPRRGFQRA